MERSVLSRSGSRQMEDAGYTLGPEQYDLPAPQNVRQIAPQGRHAQHRNRDIIEKNLLRNRCSGYERHSDEILEPFKIESGGPLYMSDADRYHTDVAGEARMNRINERQKQEVADYHLRAERQERETRRWDSLETKAREEELYLHTMRVTGEKTRKNISGAAFNLITHKIDQNDSGRALQERDTSTRNRAYERTKRMTRANNSSYNPITGADYGEVARPMPTAY